MRATAKHETDILIVGAGPTGLTLACELLRRGVSCRIIGKAASPATTSRALGLQPRTLALFDTMGIVDRVLATGGPVIEYLRSKYADASGGEDTLYRQGLRKTIE